MLLQVVPDMTAMLPEKARKAGQQNLAVVQLQRPDSQ